MKDISLKTRKFIGNTSMDPQLSLLMANQGLAGKGDLVFDPFVGSGSLLVAAAKFGAYVRFMLMFSQCTVCFTASNIISGYGH